VSQSEYLREEVNDEKLDLEEYLELKENPAAKYAEVKEKEKNTLKKVAYYTKERNVSLMDSAVKSLLFWFISNNYNKYNIVFFLSHFNVFDIFEGLLDHRNISHVGVSDS